MSDRRAPTHDETITLDQYAPDLAEILKPELWEWSTIGDNSLAAWNWAKRVEREEGIHHQVALQYVANVLIPDAYYEQERAS